MSVKNDLETRLFPAQVMSFMPRTAARRNYGKTRATVASIARERIEILIDEARKRVRDDVDLSKRYVDLARRISERTKVRIPIEMKKYLCKGCGVVLIPGHNAKIRLRAGKNGLVITCLSCGTMKRYPITGKVRPRYEPGAMKPYIAQNLPFPKKNSSEE